MGSSDFGGDIKLPALPFETPPPQVQVNICGIVQSVNLYWKEMVEHIAHGPRHLTHDEQLRTYGFINKEWEQHYAKARQLRDRYRVSEGLPI